MKIFDTFENISKLVEKLDKINVDSLNDEISSLKVENDNIHQKIDEMKNEINLVKEELSLTLMDIIKVSTLMKTHQEAIMKLFEAYAKLVIKKTDNDEVEKLLNDKSKKNNNNLN